VSEEQFLVNRIRVYILVMVLSFSLQGPFLIWALESNGSAVAWIIWAAILAFSVTALGIAGVRAGRLSKRYRKLKWGEE
jgi:hypothetical protein